MKEMAEFFHLQERRKLDFKYQHDAATMEAARLDPEAFGQWLVRDADAQGQFAMRQISEMDEVLSRHSRESRQVCEAFLAKNPSLRPKP